VLIVNPSLPIHSVADLIRLARKAGRSPTVGPGRARRIISTPSCFAA
jgi:hypothetical protein